MSFKSNLLMSLQKIPVHLEHVFVYHARYKTGEEDFVKAILNAKPISFEQKRRVRQYWAPYVQNMKERIAFDLRWFDIYNRTNVFGFKLEQYIPDSYYYAIVDNCLTNTLDAPVLDDKNLYDLLFHDVNQSLTLIRKSGGGNFRQPIQSNLGR